MDDLSDRELERFLRENLAAKLFCDFTLSSKTPDHLLFGYIIPNPLYKPTFILQF